ncbi:MAG TPA: hypothetical protein DCO83_00230 [Mucilaginibacter sp.]|nr:hypothetical protein [Mucilaginibacter sp.]
MLQALQVPQGHRGRAGDAIVSSYLLTGITVAVTGTTLSVPAIDQSVVDEGLVIVYFSNTGTTGPWYSLPFTNGGVTISMVSFGVGAVTLTSTTQQTGLDFRVVVIPGTSVTKLNVTNPNLNFRNFTAVANALHLSK